MSPYLIVFLLLLVVSTGAFKRIRFIGAIWGTQRDFLTSLFSIALVILIALSKHRSEDFRYYIDYYNMAPTWFDFSNELFHSHVEFGWALLCTVFKILGFSYGIYFTIVTAAMILMVNRFIRLYCYDNSRFALLYVYSTFYLVYCFIGMRQALSICLFMGYMVPMIEKRHWLRYCVMTGVCMMFHTVGLLYILVPLVIGTTCRRLYYLLTASLLFCIVARFTRIDVMLFSHIPLAGALIYLEGDTSFSSIAYRCVCILAAVYAGHYSNLDQKGEFLFKLYLIGASMYFVIANTGLMANRVFDLFKIIEVRLFISYFERGRYRAFFTTAILLLTGWMFWFHLDAINQVICYETYVPEIPVWKTPFIPFTWQEMSISL